jgi:hypothetical protein
MPFDLRVLISASPNLSISFSRFSLKGRPTPGALYCGWCPLRYDTQSVKKYKARPVM